ncbi:hypothetical protein F9B85_12415 [Heliorestis acidaminivorans]|uniref:MurNAc-LAA domain-containing protein n=1 Tax=Heliorestis acidaminivorans TaxID=553427 RepID=A0A6I0EUG9_9FIRM|nr:N-acetylmuramoyl-L-alanine amidase [Heliorestis acidaminivorans]KAB2951378.1 hypothetical protein F9B85_12415 [Heliorestis acidaminivorans]
MSVILFIGRVRKLLTIALTVLVVLVLSFGAYQWYKGIEGQTAQAISNSVKGKVVVIDAGHGGQDGGAKGRQGTLEKEINLQVAKKVANYLEEYGVTVLMTREDDNNLVTGRWSQRAELTKRVEKAREAQADIYVAIHCNSFPSPRWSGHQTFYQPGSEEGKRLALHIQNEITRRVGNKDKRQAKAEDYFVLRTSHCPAVMTEIGFLSNPTEEALLKTENHQKQIALGITEGILRFLEGKAAPEKKTFFMEKP